jgi:hypothetical protein
MEEKHVARGQPRSQAREHARRVAGDGVEAAAGPRYIAQPRARQHQAEQRAAEAYRRAEELRRSPGDRGERGLRRFHLAPQERDAVEGEGVGVAMAVVLDAVPRR